MPRARAAAPPGNTLIKGALPLLIPTKGRLPLPKPEPRRCPGAARWGAPGAVVTVFCRNNVPFSYASWGYLSDEVEARLTRGERKLGPAVAPCANIFLLELARNKKILVKI